MIYRRLFEMPGWGAGSSLSELDRLRRQISQLFDEYPASPFARLRPGVFPPVNLTENRDYYFLRAELPGVAPGDLDIQATANTVSISGERKIATEGDNARYHRRERDAGRFSRVVGLPGDVDTAKVEAKMSDGILTIRVAKAEKAKPRQITVG